MNRKRRYPADRLVTRTETQCTFLFYTPSTNSHAQSVGSAIDKKMYGEWEEKVPRLMEFELCSLPCDAFEQTWTILCMTCSVSYVLGFRMCFSMITTQKVL